MQAGMEKIFRGRVEWAEPLSLPAQAEGHMSLTLTFINQAADRALSKPRGPKLTHGRAEAALRHMGSSAQGPFVSSFNIGS